MKVLITGANGFIGKNLHVVLRNVEGLEVIPFCHDNSEAELATALAEADLVFHLAGVNRPPDVAQFETGNVGLTRQICDILKRVQRSPKIIFSSSSQAAVDNPYGQSKFHAERELRSYAQETGGEIGIYRLKNVFGKWSRPNYNSVVATFCHNVSHGVELTINEPEKQLDLVYIDDIIAEFLREVAAPRNHDVFREVPRFTRVSVGRIAELIQSFPNIRSSLVLPRMDDRFVQELYATYLSHLPPENFAYDLKSTADERGLLAEFLKSDASGQMFISRTNPGYVRGNHYHHTKTEKFLVVEGDAVIRFRHIMSNAQTEFVVSGLRPRVVDIPPGWTHNIENIGSGELVTLFWASELFDSARPDTTFEKVNL